MIEGGELDYRRVNVAQQENDPTSLLNWMRQALHIRSQHPAFGSGSLSILPLPNPAILAYLRQGESESLLVVNNLSSSSQHIDLQSLGLNTASITGLFASLPGERIISTHTPFELEPYGFRWYQCD